jgi:transcription elongation factor Elf1
MPLTGPVSVDKKFFCPSCGALYSVIYKSGAKKESGKESSVAKCVVCLKVMSETESANIPVYTLIHRPEDA